MQIFFERKKFTLEKVTEEEFNNAKKDQLEDYKNSFIKPKRLAVDICSQAWFYDF